MKMILEYDVNFLLGKYFKKSTDYEEFFDHTAPYVAIMYVTLGKLHGINTTLCSTMYGEVARFNLTLMEEIVVNDTDSWDYRELSTTLSQVENIINIKYLTINTFEVEYV